MHSFKIYFMRRRRNSLIAIIALMTLNISCSKSGSTYNSTPNPPANSNTVDIYGMAFKPSTLTVKSGTKITWTNSDGFAHTVTADNGTTFSSGNLATGATFSFTASTAGTFNYHCNIHSGMTATIVVTQ